MRLQFSLPGGHGQVDVAVATTVDPADVGAGPAARGIPNCLATIEFSGEGYHGLMGWVQLVRSDDNVSRGERFEMDPLDILGDVDHPFAFYGIAPALFDAPSRDTGVDLGWMANSFLAVIDPESRHNVRCLLGFGWGFTIDTDASTWCRPPRCHRTTGTATCRS